MILLLQIISFSAKSVEQKVRNGLLVFVGLRYGFGSSVMNGDIDDGGNSIGCACGNIDK